MLLGPQMPPGASDGLLQQGGGLWPAAAGGAPGWGQGGRACGLGGLLQRSMHQAVWQAGVAAELLLDVVGWVALGCAAMMGRGEGGGLHAACR